MLADLKAGIGDAGGPIFLKLRNGQLFSVEATLGITSQHFPSVAYMVTRNSLNSTVRQHHPVKTVPSSP